MNKKTQQKGTSYYGLYEQDIEDFIQIFQILDINRQDKLQPQVLLEILESSNFHYKNPIMNEIFHELCDLQQRDSNEGITKEQFLNTISLKLKEKQTRQGVDKIFNLFDIDKDNKLNLDNLKRIANEIGENISQEELQDLIDRISQDGKHILKDDFYNALNKSSY